MNRLGARIEDRNALFSRTPLARRDATYLTATIVLWAAVLTRGAMAAAAFPADGSARNPAAVSQATQEAQAPANDYQGKMVLAVELPRVAVRKPILWRFRSRRSKWCSPAAAPIHRGSASKISGIASWPCKLSRP